MTSSASSKLRDGPAAQKHPRPYFHLNFAYARYDRQRGPFQRKRQVLRTQEGSLSLINSMPIDVLYEVRIYQYLHRVSLGINTYRLQIFTYLHPQDILSLSRSTHRLRQLLMTRDAKFVWKSALSNVHGFPFCPPDLSEPQFASLAFDEECHVSVELNVFFKDTHMRSPSGL